MQNIHTNYRMKLDQTPFLITSRSHFLNAETFCTVLITVFQLLIKLVTKEKKRYRIYNLRNVPRNVTINGYRSKARRYSMYSHHFVHFCLRRNAQYYTLTIKKKKIINEITA